MEPKSTKVDNQQTVPQQHSWLDWIRLDDSFESRERFGEGVPANMARTSPFPRDSRGIFREYATTIIDQKLGHKDSFHV